MLCLSTKTYAVRVAAFVSILLVATSCVYAATPVEEARAALDELNRWLESTSTGPGWQKFLHTDKIEEMLDKPEKADPVIIAAILRQFSLGAPQTNDPRFVKVSRALERWLGEIQPPVNQLPAVARAAKSSFIPKTNEDVSKAKEALVKALGRLDARLDPRDSESAKWKTYLEWDALQEQIEQAEKPDLKTLGRIHGKYAADHEGLDTEWFVDVREALEQYLATIQATDTSQLEAQYKTVLDELAAALTAYAKKPTFEEATAISDRIRWLDDIGQAAWLVAGIRHHYSKPNFFGRIDANVVAAGIDRPVDETGPVRDVILGTSIRGTGHTVGQIKAELIPSETHAEVHTVFDGTVSSDTVGTNGPARIYGSGVTTITTRKPIVINAEGFSTLPATSEATTKSTVKRVSAGRGGAAQRTAQSRVYQQKSQAERISAQHAEAQANRRANEQADEMIGEAQEGFVTKFRDPLLERGLFPKQFDFSSTKDAVRLTGLQVGPYDLGAPVAPPKPIPTAHLAAQMHESMVNNAAEEAFSGETLTEEEFRETLKDYLGEVPEQFEADESRKPWRITFAQRQPIVVNFFDGQFRITIHGRRYASGDSTYPGMDVTVLYKIVREGSVVKAVRQGELAIFPPGFEQGKDRLSVRYQTVRRMLERRFGKIFEAEVIPEPIELPGNWAKTGKYGLDQWDTANGWGVMAWNRIPGSEVKSDPAADSDGETAP